MTTKIQTVMLTGRTHTTASRAEGVSGAQERLDIQLSTPGDAGRDIVLSAVEMHPTAEQLFAGAWSACYTAALRFAAQRKKVTLPPDMSVDIEVDLGKTDGAYFIQARIDVGMPGVAPDVANTIASAAHAICPYSKAVHGNIDVVTHVVAADAVAA